MMIELIKIIWRNRSGATAIEYALTAALIAVAVIAGISVLGPAVSGLWSAVSTDVGTAMS